MSGMRVQGHSSVAMVHTWHWKNIHLAFRSTRKAGFCCALFRSGSGKDIAGWFLRIFSNNFDLSRRGSLAYGFWRRLGIRFQTLVFIICCFEYNSIQVQLKEKVYSPKLRYNKLPYIQYAIVARPKGGD